MAERRDDPARLAALAAAMAAVLRRGLVESFERLLSGRQLAEIRELVQAGRFAEAIEVTEAAFAPTGRSWMEALTRGADDTARLLRSFGISLDFDPTAEFVIRALRENQLRLVSGLVESQRAALREAILQAISRGLGTRETTELLRSAIGLTRRQVRAVENYRTLLASGNSQALRRIGQPALPPGRLLTNSQILRMVDRYRQGLLSARLRDLSNMEAVTAVNAGARQVYLDAVRDGLLAESEIVRTWKTVPDERRRESHSFMSGQQQIGLSTPFISGNGNHLLYPADPNAPIEDRIHCRCSVAVTLGAIG